MGNLLINSGNMPDIKFEYDVLDVDGVKMFMMLKLMKDDVPDDDEDLVKFLNKDTIGRIVMLRHRTFKPIHNLPDIENRVLVLIDYISGGRPGSGILMLMDLCAKVNKDKITFDDFTQNYPLGYYSSETQREIVNRYVKTGKAKFSEMYNLK